MIALLVWKEAAGILCLLSSLVAAAPKELLQGTSGSSLLFSHRTAGLWLTTAGLSGSVSSEHRERLSSVLITMGFGVGCVFGF